MTKFVEYSSIANADNPRMIEKFASACKFYDIKTLWVTEKRHGANFSIITDGKEISFASRTQVLRPEENFYRFFEQTNLVEHLKQTILVLHEMVAAEYGNDCVIQLFGELFGGTYPHPDVCKNNQCSKVQKGVYYSPDLKFEAFDCLITFTSWDETQEQTYLSQTQLHYMCYKSGITTVPVYSVVDIESMTQKQIEDEISTMFSTVLKRHPVIGEPLPEIEGNCIEGVVISPDCLTTLPTGSRAILKLKNEKFSEIKNGSVETKKQVELTDCANQVLSDMMRFITLNRMEAVISKTGMDPRENMEHFGKTLGLMTQDILKDYDANFTGYVQLVKEEQKIVRKHLTAQVSKFIKQMVKEG